MFKKIAEFVENKMSKYLCGFRKGYITQHALMRLLDKLNKSIDKGRKTDVFMMDLTKACDCISHDLLIAKIGIENQSLKLIHNYLNGRIQKVKTNSKYSTWKEIISGVPQRSVLCPLLFNIFINDLFLFIVNSDICNFADDNTLSISDVSIEQIISRLEFDIDIVQTWFCNNGMLLNKTKCKFLIVESFRNKRVKKAKIQILNKEIVESEEEKRLCITIDNNLKMNKHIKQCVNHLVIN